MLNVQFLLFVLLLNQSLLYCHLINFIGTQLHEILHLLLNDVIVPPSPLLGRGRPRAYPLHSLLRSIKRKQPLIIHGCLSRLEVELSWLGLDANSELLTRKLSDCEFLGNRLGKHGTVASALDPSGLNLLYGIDLEGCGWLGTQLAEPAIFQHNFLVIVDGDLIP